MTQIQLHSLISSKFRLNNPNHEERDKERNELNQIYKGWMSWKNIFFTVVFFFLNQVDSFPKALLPAPKFSDRGQSLLCAMAMTPERGVMMRF